MPTSRTVATKSTKTMQCLAVIIPARQAGDKPRSLSLAEQCTNVTRYIGHKKTNERTVQPVRQAETVAGSRRSRRSCVWL